MSHEFSFSIKSIRFDENYQPAQNTRATTNFANLARGENRVQNLRNTLNMINHRFNALAHWDNPTCDRYHVELDIISVDMQHQSCDASFPSIEVLQTNIVDSKTGQRHQGIVGNNFSSYVRDYDFSIRLAEYNKDKTQFSVPDDFGELHATDFQSLCQFRAL